MRKLPQLHLLTPIAIALLAGLSSGCSLIGGSNDPHELQLKGSPGGSSYDDRMLDAVGQGQAFTEQQILQQRQINDVGTDVQRAQAQAAQLEARLGTMSYETGSGGPKPSAEEANRIAEFHAATQASQTRVAEEQAKLALRRSTLENTRDSEIGAAERNADRLIAEAQNRLIAEKARLEQATASDIARIREQVAAQKVSISSRYNTDIAQLVAQSDMAVSKVVAPVVTGRAVYAGTYTESPTAYQPSAPKAGTRPPLPAPRPVPARSKPDIVKRDLAPTKANPPTVVAKFKPATPITKLHQPGDVILAGANASVSKASAAPHISAPIAAPAAVVDNTRKVYDVMYVYKDQASWERFQKFLAAYDVKELVPVHDNEKGVYYIYAGRFYDQATAQQRLNFLNKTTSSNHAQIRERDVPK